MKNILIAILAFSFLQISCNKADDLNTTTFRVKIIKEICNDAIVQLVDSTSNANAEDGFVFEGRTYDNVFSPPLVVQTKQKCNLSPVI